MSPQVPGGGLLRTAGLPQLLSGFGGAGGAAPWPGSRLVLWSVPRCGRMPPGHGRLSPLCRLPQHPPGLRVPLPARLRWGRDHPLQPHVSRAQGARGVASVWGARRQDTAILRATGNTQWTSHGMGMFGWHGDHARPPRGMGIFGGHGDHVLPPHGMGMFGGTWGPRTPFPCPGDAEGTQELAPTIPVLRGCVGETGAAVGGPHTVPPYVSSPPGVMRTAATATAAGPPTTPASATWAGPRRLPMPPATGTPRGTRPSGTPRGTRPPSAPWTVAATSTAAARRLDPASATAARVSPRRDPSVAPRTVARPPVSPRVPLSSQTGPMGSAASSAAPAASGMPRDPGAAGSAGATATASLSGDTATGPPAPASAPPPPKGHTASAAPLGTSGTPGEDRGQSTLLSAAPQWNPNRVRAPRPLCKPPV